MIKVNIFLTTSKLAAYIILSIGSIYSFVFIDPTVLISTFSATSAILMLKSFTTSKTDQKNIENKNIENKTEV